MHVIWVIEPPEQSTLSRALIGDFAVRSVASLASLGTLLRLNKKAPPHLVVVSGSALQEAPSKSTLATLLVLRQAEITIVIIGSCAAAHAKLAHVHYADSDIDSFKLSRLVASCAHDRGPRFHKAEGHLRYKDVSLDPGSLTLRIPHMEPIALTPKEAQLLRMFLSGPERCVSRSQIVETVWPRTNVTPRTVDTHISRLRSRLRDTEVTIEAIYGGGYVLR